MWKIVTIAMVLSVGMGFSATAQEQGLDCVFADGTVAPKPGFREEALTSDDWAPEMATLYTYLKDTDRSALDEALGQPNAIIMAARCSWNDMFMTHLSQTGLTETFPEAMEGLKPELAQHFRAYAITERGYQSIPGLVGYAEKRMAAE